MNVLNVRNQRDLCLSKDHHNFKKLKNFFKNVFVRVKPSGRKKQIRDLQEFADEYRFNKDNGPTTVKVRTLHSFSVTRLIWTVYLQRHFSEVYNISLQLPKMFGIVTGSKERKVVYPAELCIVEAGQFYRKKVPSELTKSVVDFATKTPQERLHIINSGIGLGHPGSLAAPVSDLGFSATNSMVLIANSRRLNMRHRRLFRTLVYVSCQFRHHILV
jgi:eukaryotic translation initiation factor 2C